MKTWIAVFSLAAAVAAVAGYWVLRGGSEEVPAQSSGAPRAPEALSPPRPIGPPGSTGLPALVPPGLATAPPARASASVPPAGPPPALPPGFADLVPQPAGVRVQEVRQLSEHAHWVALLWRGQSASDAAAAYRTGIEEMNWRVLTPGTAEVQLRSLVQLGLAQGAPAQEILVGSSRGRTVALRFLDGPEPRSIRGTG